MAKSYFDDAGQIHGPAPPSVRILSLVPSLTELLLDIGLGAQVVGRTNFCVHPATAVSKIPSVGGTKQINLEKVLELNPSYALVNIDETPKPLAQELKDLGIEVIVTHPISVTDNRKLFRLVGGLFGVLPAAERMTGAFDTALTNLRGCAKTWPKRRILYLIWKKPWMSISAETYIASVLAEANWQIINYPSKERYPKITLDNTLIEQVDLVLFSTEPFPFTAKHIDQFRQDFPDHGSKAKLIDAEMVSWYGSRAITGLRFLTEFADGISS